ncbi:MAG TPA: ATP-binding protein, partial [Anaerolineales bacterium]|nr:ATP-binding protein [Anaerolineales bacterium]
KQLQQIFQDLLDNAFKFHAHHQTPHIHISAMPRTLGTRTEWVFCVQDNGIGIEPQYFERIFEIFKRLHSQDEYPGVGIGLTICKRIVEKHGGQIWVESQVGEGSTFFFTFPNPVVAL